MRIGIIGAGMIGSTLGTLWAEAGHEVRFASRHPDRLTSLVKSAGPRASAGTPADAATSADVVLLAVPLKALPSLAHDLAALLTGKVVMDASNAYARRDGDLAAEATRHPGGSAAWAAEMFPGARWVKAFNTVYFETLATEAHRQRDPIGIPLAGNDPAALDLTAQLVRDAGFDPVAIGTIERGKEFEPETRPYNTGMSGRELREMFALQ